MSYYGGGYGGGYPQPPPNPYQQYPGYPQFPQEKKHSGIGIASFVMSLVSITISVVTFTLIATMLPNKEISEKSPEAIAIGLAFIAALVISLIGAALGIGGLFQPNRKLLFAILGVCLNVLIVLGVIGLIVLGSVSK